MELFYMIAIFAGGAFTLVQFFVLCDNVRRIRKSFERAEREYRGGDVKKEA